ncbi:MAG: T9SS type A sorting domain-containing protein [Bacteroidota bacterium]|nr:T9SS type A sorting domain-containing protein [Bacteroidota bacterium]
MKKQFHYSMFFKTLLISLISIFIISSTYSQVGDYNFIVQNNTYDTLSNPTQLIGGNQDDTWSSVTNIGFNFTYNNVTYSKFIANANGFIKFDTNSFSTSYSNDLASTTKTTVLGALWDDLKTNVNGQVGYSLSGSAGSRILTVEFKDIKHLSAQVDMNFQIKLYEAGDSIKFVYGSMDTWTGESASIGINDEIGATNHFISVTPGTTHTTSSTVANNIISSNANLSSGLTYVFYYQTFTKDLGVTAILNPDASGCGLTSSEQLKLKVKNFGTQTQNSYTLKYSINNGSTYVSQNFTTSIAPDSTHDFIFTQTADLSSAGTYKIIAIASLPNDSNATNDTFRTQIISIGSISSFPFTENFNSGNTNYFRLISNDESDIYIENSTGVNNTHSLHFEGNSATGYGSWPVTAYHAWNSYPDHIAQAVTCNVNATSLSSLVLRFDIKQIYSYDATYSWLRVLINDTIQIADNNADTNFNPTSQYSDPFTTKIFNLSSYTGTQFTITIEASCKYNDANGTGGYGDNVFVDNIQLYQPVANDVGISSIIEPNSSLCGKTSDSLSVIISNYGTSFQTSIPVTASIIKPTGTSTLTGTYTDTLTSNSSDTLYLGTINTTATGNYTITSYTTLSSDAQNTNDTTTKVISTSIPQPLPYVEDFEGTNPTQNWTTDMTVGSGHGNYSNVLYDNLWSSSTTAYAFYNNKVGTLNSTSYISFNYRIVDYSSPYNSTTLSNDDNFNVVISDDCGLTFDTLYTIDNSNHTASGSMQTLNISLSSYAGSSIIFGFLLSRPSSGDFYFDLDSIVINSTFGLGPDTSICQGDSVTLDPGSDTSYIYKWKSTSSSIILSTNPTYTTSVAGTYFVEVYDNSTFFNSDTITITVNPLPIANAGINDTICNGSTATLTASGGNSFIWSTMQTSASINVSPNSTANYFVTVYNSHGCSDIDTVTIFVKASPVVNLGNDTAFCDGNSVTLDAGQGSGYSYDWKLSTSSNTISTNQSLTVTQQGTYLATVTNTNNCSTTDSIIITVHPTPTANAGTDQDICLGDSATLTASGGGEYLWNTTEKSASIIVSPNSSRTYNVIVSNNYGCSDTAYVHVTVNNPPTAFAGNDTILNCGDSGRIGTSATANYSYQWNPITDLSNPNISNPYAKPGMTTIYNLLVTDNQTSCTANDDIKIFITGGPTANAGKDTSICKGESITLIATGGTLYSWNVGSGGPVLNVSPSQTTTYVVTVGIGGCYDIDSVTVTVKELPNINISTIPDKCENGSKILLNSYVIPSGGSWSSQSAGFELATNSFNPSKAGAGNHTIYYEYTSSTTNCTNIDSAIIVIKSIPSVSFSGLDTMYCSTESPATLTGNPLNGTFSGNGITGNAFYPKQATIGKNTITYEFTATNGCSDIDTQHTTVNPTPNPDLGKDTAICGKSTIQLDAGSGFSDYLWNDNSKKQTLTVDSSGIGYGVKEVWVKVNKLGCTGYDTIFITFEDCSGIDESIENLEVKIYPNPAKENIFVSISKQQTRIHLQLINPQGKNILEEDFEAYNEKNIKEIDVSKLAKGIYFIKISSDNSVVLKKFVLE